MEHNNLINTINKFWSKFFFQCFHYFFFCFLVFFFIFFFINFIFAKS